MKTFQLLFLIAITIISKNIHAQTSIPQLQAGVYINQSIRPEFFSLTPSCDSIGSNSANFSGPSPFVSGVEFKLIVTQVPSPPDSAYTIQSGALHIGDTLSLFNTVILSSPGVVLFSLNIVGTPTVPFETYPCSIDFIVNFGLCFDGWQIIDAFPPATCTVDDFNSISNPNSESQIILSPNPASDHLEISTTVNLKHEKILRLFNSLGVEIQSEILPVNFTSGNFKINAISSGLYFFNISDQFGYNLNGKLVIQKH